MLSGRIVRVVQETPSVKLFGVQLEKPFDFKPGQFVMLSAVGYVDKIGKGPKRAYSIASAPGGVELELVIKINAGPCFSAYLDTLKVGDAVQVDGPYGTFFLHEPVGSETVFIAGGTGIAPLMSMIRHVQEKKVPRMKLLFGVKTSKDMIYRNELDGVKNLDVVYCLSQEKSGDFFHGRVTSVLLEHVKPTSIVYLCGSPDFVKDVLVLLEERCVLAENIHKEQW